jgi:hypothetical protein
MIMLKTDDLTYKSISGRSRVQVSQQGVSANAAAEKKYLNA